MFSDITEEKQHQESLEKQAHSDALTGLPNRALLRHVDHAMYQAKQNGRNRYVVSNKVDRGHDATPPGQPTT